MKSQKQGFTDSAVTINFGGTLIWAALIAGFGAGLVHVLSGVDHLAAVAPLALGKGKRGWRTGLEWGFGHSSGVFAIGVLALAFRELLPLGAISSVAEKVVGVTLLGVGAWGICNVLRVCAHAPTRAAFGIGTIHGLGGSSHLLGVIPALMFPSPIHVTAYITAFAAGTISGMIAFSSVMGALPHRAYRLTLTACSCIALVIGCYWLSV